MKDKTQNSGHKLPHLPRRLRPDGEAARLSRWFRDWDELQEIRKRDECCAKHNVPLPLEKRVRQKTDLIQWTGPFHLGVKVGEIRELAVTYTAAMVDPVCIAVLSEWPPNPEVQETYSKGKRFLVAKFSGYREPATTTEWATGIDKRGLRALCAWNTRDVSAGFLEEGWVIRQLTAQQLADAWEVFRHALIGVPVSDRVRAQVGAPIVHPRDLRLEYQKEEAERFAVLCEGS